MNLDTYLGERGLNRNSHGTEVMLFLVGPAGTPFQVHEELLFERIPYLDVDDPLNPKLLPDDDPTVFQFLVNYIYEPQGRIPPVKPTNACGEIISPWEAIELYRLAEKWEVYDLSDAVMSRLVEYHKEMDVLPSPAFVRRAYEKADPSMPVTPLTYYCVHAFRYVHSEHYHEYRGTWTWDKVQKLFKEFPSFFKGAFEIYDCVRPDPREYPICTFHRHPKNERCT